MGWEGAPAAPLSETPRIATIGRGEENRCLVVVSGGAWRPATRARQAAAAAAGAALAEPWGVAWEAGALAA